MHTPALRHRPMRPRRRQRWLLHIAIAPQLSQRLPQACCSRGAALRRRRSCRHPSAAAQGVRAACAAAVSAQALPAPPPRCRALPPLCAPPPTPRLCLLWTWAPRASRLRAWLAAGASWRQRKRATRTKRTLLRRAAPSRRRQTGWPPRATQQRGASPRCRRCAGRCRPHAAARSHLTHQVPLRASFLRAPAWPPWRCAGRCRR